MLSTVTIYGFSLDEIKNIFTMIAAVITAISAAWRWVWVPSSKLLKTIDTISKEFTPNGGSSMKDAINRLEIGQKHNTERHKILVGELGIAFFEADEKGECVWVSPKWSKITGISPEEATGNGWINSIHPWDREKVAKEWADSVRQRRSFNLTYIVNSQESPKVIAHASPLKDIRGNTTGIIGTISLIENDDKDSKNL